MVLPGGSASSDTLWTSARWISLRWVGKWQEPDAAQGWASQRLTADLIIMTFLLKKNHTMTVVSLIWMDVLPDPAVRGEYFCIMCLPSFQSITSAVKCLSPCPNELLAFSGDIHSLEVVWTRFPAPAITIFWAKHWILNSMFQLVYCTSHLQYLLLCF